MCVLNADALKPIEYNNNNNNNSQSSLKSRLSLVGDSEKILQRGSTSQHNRCIRACVHKIHSRLQIQPLLFSISFSLFFFFIISFFFYFSADFLSSSRCIAKRFPDALYNPNNISFFRFASSF